MTALLVQICIYRYLSNPFVSSQLLLKGVARLVVQMTRHEVSH